MWFALGLVVMFCSLISSKQHRDYEGCKVYKITPRNEEQTHFLYDLSMSDKWNLIRAVNDSTVVMVFPEDQQKLELHLQTERIFFHVDNYNLSETILPLRNPCRNLRAYFPGVDFRRYARFSEITDYLHTLALLYPSKVTLKTEGESFEGRQIKSIRITNGDRVPDKKVIFVDAGIHAREWIAPAAALYIIYQLVEYQEENEHLLENFDWIILPMVNPDGYEYSHDHERLWRKTRQRFSEKCFGTDGNRNFDFHWGEARTSHFPCDRLFGGPSAFSEPETRIVRDIMHSVNNTCTMYLSLHSFGRYLVYPWGYTSSFPSTWKDLDEVANAGASAIQRSTGFRYKVGAAGAILYPASGGSDDYAYGAVGIPIAITMELPGGGPNHFDPDKRDILWMVEEAWIGVKAMAEKVDEMYG